MTCPSRFPALEVALPGFADQVDAERMMRLLGDKLEARPRVNAARRGEDALRPQCHSPVAGFPGKAQAFVDEALAEAEPARLRIDDQQPQLGDLVALAHHEDRA